MVQTKLVIPPEAFVVNHLFEDSEFFLQAAKEVHGKDQDTTRRYIRASIITAFAALEALLNILLYLLEEADDLELVERAFVQEKRVELTEDGYFDMSGQQFRSLEQKIAFLHWRTKGLAFPKGDAIWSAFVDATRLRNEIVHPKPGLTSYSKLTASAAESCLKATLEIAGTFGWTKVMQTAR